MSAFFLAINLDKSAIEPRLAQRMSAQLSRFGEGGSESVVRENFALAQHRPIIPADQGLLEPRFDEELQSYLMFEGRIDNRTELIAQLPQEFQQHNDADLFFAVLKHAGESALERVIGPFVFVLFTPETGRVLAGRDAMGGRYLTYAKTANALLIATHEMALAAHPAVGYEIDTIKATRLLTNAMDGQPRSLLRGTSVLNPGHTLEFRAGRLSTRPFYLPDPAKRLPSASNGEYAAEFRRLLTQAVERRIPRHSQIATMLSGGLDSVPMTIAASNVLSRTGRALKSYSWVFDQFSEADERRYVQALTKRVQFEPSYLVADKAWFAWQLTSGVNPLIPFRSPYASLQAVVLERARQDGVGVLLSGLGGDMLYSGTEHLFAELIAKGRLMEFLKQGAAAWRGLGGARPFLRRYVWNLIRAKDRVAPIKPWWLSDEAARAQVTEQSWLAELQTRAARPAQYFNAVGSLEGEDAHYGRFLDAEYGVERRYPFRDRELVEFMLALPTDQLFWRGQSRPIVRRAFSEELPEEIAERRDKTNFESYILGNVARDNTALMWQMPTGDALDRIVSPSNRAQNNAQRDEISVLEWRLAYYRWWKAVCYTSTANELGLDHAKSG